MRKIQIGIIGSMADIKLEENLKTIATEIGHKVAQSGAVLVFGFEGDFESLSFFAAKGAHDKGGQTLAFSWGSKKLDLGELNSMEVVTGQQRGGGREFSLVLSCDAVISISGGSGTLMEIAIAYQAGIPVVALNNSSGWSEKLSDQFLDDRKREKVVGANSPQEAVQLALKLAKDKINSLKDISL